MGSRSCTCFITDHTQTVHRNPRFTSTTVFLTGTHMEHTGIEPVTGQGVQAPSYLPDSSESRRMCPWWGFSFWRKLMASHTTRFRLLLSGRATDQPSQRRIYAYQMLWVTLVSVPAGFEPAECMDQNHVSYHLTTAQSISDPRL